MITSILALILPALKAIAAFCGFGSGVVAEFHDSSQRQAGRDEQAVASLQAQKDANEQAVSTHETANSRFDAARTAGRVPTDFQTRD